MAVLELFVGSRREVLMGKVPPAGCRRRAAAAGVTPPAAPSPPKAPLSPFKLPRKRPIWRGVAVQSVVPSVSAGTITIHLDKAPGKAVMVGWSVAN